MQLHLLFQNSILMAMCNLSVHIIVLSFIHKILPSPVTVVESIHLLRVFATCLDLSQLAKMQVPFSTHWTPESSRPHQGGVDQDL